jgi:F-type H+-transporting ATPase subunit b
MEALGINLGFFIAQIINITVMYLILRSFVWDGLVTSLENRRERIEKGLEDARIAAEARENAEADAEQILQEARSEATQILAEARERAEESKREIANEADTEAEQIRAEARERAENERNQMLADMRGQVASLAMAAANRLIGESMDQAKQQEIVNNFFSEAPDNVKNLGANIEVVSALPLTDNEKNEIKKQTGADNIEYKVDPALLGGLVLRSGDKVVDGSVRTSLNALGSRMR